MSGEELFPRQAMGKPQQDHPQRHHNHIGRGIHKKHHGPGGIPDRWLNYDCVGRDIEGTRFVPFKTPLDKRFFNNNHQLHADDRFEVSTLIEFAQEAGKRIGLVIDLTNTDRYYDKSEWRRNDVKYVKINCPGHEVNRREDIVQKFHGYVDEFLEEFPDTDGPLIGVHCTHGLNRTGYLICRYLIDRMNWTAARAISQFEYNRGHPIERGAYKTELYRAEERRTGKPASTNADLHLDDTVEEEPVIAQNAGAGDADNDSISEEA